MINPNCSRSLVEYVRPACILTALLLAVICAPPAATAAVHYQRLKSFGFPDLVGQNPAASLLLASDGGLYGTTQGDISRNGIGTVFRLYPDGRHHVLHHFQSSAGDGSPQAGLFEGSDGALYGTTEGNYDAISGLWPGDSVFKVNKDGSSFQVLHRFGSVPGDGAVVMTGVIEGSDGALYGTTFRGGAYDNGTVFTLNKDGSAYRVVRSIGITPAGTLLEGPDGALYGTVAQGGSCDGGIVFRLTKDGTSFSAVHVFCGGTNDALNPVTGLTRGSDGMFYGATRGAVYKLNLDGTGFSVLQSLPQVPAALVEGSDGALYGTTYFGGNVYPGTYGYGTVFKVNKDGGGYRVLFSFGTITNDAQNPVGLTAAPGGLLYGTTAYGGTNQAGTVFQLREDGNGYGILYSFGQNFDGAAPFAGLVQGNDGIIYGTTETGGRNQAGTVFRLDPTTLAYAVLHNFGDTPVDGQSPRAELLAGGDGALYGTTFAGGVSGGLGNGTIFKLSPDGNTYTTLHNFEGAGSDGGSSAGLVEGSDGLLYGTTAYGGSAGGGTVFKLNKDGSSFNTLINFFGNVGNNASGLVLGSDARFYGTAQYGGAFTDQLGYGYGSVFQIQIGPFTNGYSLLVSFGPDGLGGQHPVAKLIEGADGALYGTTAYGGSNYAGVVFKVNKDGSAYRVLHHFGRPYGDGDLPQAGLVLGWDGALYGTTVGGGTNGAGTLFSLNSDGSGYAILYDFGTSDGSFPRASLIRGRDGAFYGTTSQGGDLGYGTVFRFWPPETPDSLGVAAVTGATQVSFTGMGGYNYQVLRSTDLTNWSVLATIHMPASGTYIYTDNVPPMLTAFYRAAWIP